MQEKFDQIGFTKLGVFCPTWSNVTKLVDDQIGLPNWMTILGDQIGMKSIINDQIG